MSNPAQFNLFETTAEPIYLTERQLLDSVTFLDADTLNWWQREHCCPFNTYVINKKPAYLKSEIKAWLLLREKNRKARHGHSKPIPKPIS